MDRYLRRLKNQKGFTLVELMVVVVIIGVLVAIVIPIFNNVQQNARERAHDANVRTLIGAATMFVTSEWDGTVQDETAMATALQGNYIDGNYPANPTGGDAYAVSVAADGTVTVTPAIGTYGP